MLQGTKNVRDALLAAGFNRGEFKVWTPFDTTKQGWGQTQVHLTAKLEKQIALIPAMLAQRLSITRWIIDGRESYPAVTADWLGRIEMLDSDEIKRRYDEIMSH